MTKHEATYKGIAGKTIYFLILCVVGFAAFFVLHNIFMQSAEAFGGVLTIGDVEELEGIVAINTCVYEALAFIVAALLFYLHH